METIINIVLIVIIAICAWSGYKKGLIMGVGGIIVIIVSLYGARLLAGTFSFDVISAMRPFASGFMESQLRADTTDDEKGEEAEKEKRKSVYELMGWENSELSVDDLLASNPSRQEEFCIACYAQLGLDEEMSKSLAEEAIKYAGENSTDMLSACVQVLCEKVSFVGCFLLAFVLILILLTVIGNLPNLSYKLPHLNVLNDIGGLVLGIVTGILFCTIIVWAMRFLGLLIGPETLSSAALAKFFAGHNFLSNYLKL